MRHALLLAIIVVAGCTSSDTPTTSAGQPFLEQTKLGVLPKQSWTREISSAKGGMIRYRVEAPGPYALILVTGSAFRTIQSGQRPSADGILLNADYSGVHEGTVNVPAGPCWFMIENQSPTPVDIKLSCWEAQ